MKTRIVLALLVLSLMFVSRRVDASARCGTDFGYHSGVRVSAAGPMWLEGSYWGPAEYFVAPARSGNAGQLKIETNARDASVYLNDAYAGTVKELKTFWLRSGTYDIEIRNTNGGVFDQRIFVPIGGKSVIEPVFTISSGPFK